MALFLKKFLLEILFPARCLDCRRELENEDYLCPACFKKLKFYGGRANLKLKYINELYIAGDYENRALSGLIKILKFQAISGVAKTLNRWLILFWQGQAVLKSTTPLVIPIPLSTKRRRWRGFNQAEILARSLAKNFGYSLSLYLIKIKETRAQSQLNAEKRAKNLDGVFKWSGTIPIACEILLIDDVVTTGATLEEAAKILKAAGATKISALVLAKG